MKISILLAGLAAALFTAAPLTAQTLVSWEAPVNVAATDGTLTKSAGCEGCTDAGAHSVARLTGEGYAEFTPVAGFRIEAGLGTDLSAATASSTIDYAFSLGRSGTWEIRERGVYRRDGTWAPGDRFRVSVESGRVVYRRNGALVYTSLVTPSYPLVLDTTLGSLNASLGGATVVQIGTVPVPEPPSDIPPTGPPVFTSTGPYEAVTDRLAHAKPPLPVLGPAGSTFADPVFASRITRITDATTQPESLDRSYKTPSSPHQNAWSATGSRFYVGGGGGAILPYTFDRKTGEARRIEPSASGAGGMVLKFYIEPQFSYVNDSIIYGSVIGGSLRTIDRYDFATAAYSRLIDLDTLVPGLSGTYIGGIGSSAGATERVLAMFGGIQQDLHHYAVVFDAANPQNRQLLDTKASTLNGAPLGVTLNFLLHHVMIDRSGRYVMLYPTYAEQQGVRKAPQSAVWDTQLNTFTEMPLSSRPYGHDSFGYGVSVNKDCCTTTTYDAGQWQFRSLSSPLVTRDLIPTLLTPKRVYMSDHSTWNNARPDNTAPFISGLFRIGTVSSPWRAWDDEIVAVQSDLPGADPAVWRFAHHRSNVANDLNAAATSFWYQPRPNVSPDGLWVLFTSNWEKTLGTDPYAEPGGAARQDVFLVALKSSVARVAMGASPLTAGRATVLYADTLVASGGRGTYAWRVTTGALPEGLLLDPSTGAIAGTPSIAGTSPFTVTVADAVDPLNSASADLSLSVANRPVLVTVPQTATVRLTAPASLTLWATGGSGVFTWSIASGALPAGLTLDASTGAITGIPLTMETTVATVMAAEAAEPANAASASVTIVVGGAPVRITTPALASGRARNAYTSPLQAAGGSGVATWSIAGGALPAGLALNAATGVISGNPTTAGSSPVTVAATDTLDATNVATAEYMIAIAPGVKIASPRTIPAATRAQSYTYAVQVVNVQGTVKWELAGGAMPTGITLDSATGVISGTCLTAGTWYFNARVKDASTSDTLTLTLKVQ